MKSGVFCQLLILSCITTISIKSARPKENNECQNQGSMKIARKTGQCPTGYEKSGNCCTKCQICAPGYQKVQNSNKCTAECEPCRWEDPIYRYSNNAEGTENCRPCIPCSLMNRETLVKCTRTRNAECGQCKPGYIIMDETNENSPCTKLMENGESLPSNYVKDTFVRDEPNLPGVVEPSSDDNTYKHATIILAACTGVLLSCIVVLAAILGKDQLMKWRRKKVGVERREEDDNIELENRHNARRDPVLHYEEEAAQTALMAEVTSQPNYAREETDPLTVECSGEGPAQFWGSTSKKKPSESGLHHSGALSSGEFSEKSSISEEHDNLKETSFNGHSKGPSYQRSASVPVREATLTDPQSLQSRFESVLSIYEENKLDYMNNEHLLDVAIAKAGQRVINDTPEDILDILGQFLDCDIANRNPQILKGRERFAMKLGLQKALASSLTNSNDLFSHLKGKRMPLYKMLEALFHIDRCDALCVVAKAMFNCQQWC